MSRITTVGMLLLLAIHSSACRSLIGNGSSATPSREAAIQAMHALKLDSAEECKFVAQCQDLAAFDCHSDVDGPFFFIEVSKPRVVQCCGGCCQNGPGTGTTCSECPPKTWTCPVQNGYPVPER